VLNVTAIPSILKFVVDPARKPSKLAQHFGQQAVKPKG
jgi:hypothetical protein